MLKMGLHERSPKMVLEYGSFKQVSWEYGSRIAVKF